MAALLAALSVMGASACSIDAPPVPTKTGGASAQAAAPTPPLPSLTSAQQVYTTPGNHLFGDRHWRTTCEKYSSTIVRCLTELFGTQYLRIDGVWHMKEAWGNNNVTYLPATREQWGASPLATPGSWSDGGRRWKTECATPATGKDACRTWVRSSVKSVKNGRVTSKDGWVLGSILLFATASVPPVSELPSQVDTDPSPPVDGLPVPAEKPKSRPQPVTEFTPPGRTLPDPVSVVAPEEPALEVDPMGAYYPVTRYSCPAEAPIKGNADSGIFHVPGQEYYSATHPEVCFASERGARFHGFRKAYV